MKITITAADRRRHQQIRKIQKHEITLSRAIAVYNYLTEYGTHEITDADIEVHYGA